MDILNFNQYNEKLKPNQITLSDLDNIHVCSGFYDINSIDKNML